MPVERNQETAAASIVRVLESSRVDVIFALPGEENLALVSALGDSSIEVVVCRHEQHASFMAVAHARLTGRLGVCLATLGPGALNLLTGLAQAQLIGVPVLALTGQKALLDNREGSFQVVDVVGSASAIVGYATSIVDPARAATRVAEAISRALVGPGAVLVELPEDVADTTIPVRSHSTARPFESIAPPAALAALHSRIEGARRPLILAGQGCSDDRVSRHLLQRCLASGLSVVTTQMGKGSVPESSARSLRSLGMHRPDYVNAAMAASDLLICIGYQPVEHPPLAWNADLDHRIVHVHSRPARRELGYEPELEVVGEIVDTLDRLDGVETETGWTDAARASINACLEAELDELAETSIARVPDIIAEVVSEDHVVALDNGLYKIWFARRFPALHPHSLVLDNALATMGAGLATGMVAARLRRPALVVTGDGGFLMNGAELETAQRLALDLTVLVLRDDRFGFIAWHQDEQGRHNEGVELSNPDLVAFAASFGARGRRVTTGDELAIALRDSSPGVTVIDYPVDYTCNAILERDDLLAQAQERIDGDR